MKHVSARIVALLCVVSVATIAAVEIWPSRRNVQTTDQNGDGRPDVWRHFNAHGQVTQVDVDSNFDGKPDIEEYYEHGVLVRRESDRNFNGQADLVEEFDVATHGQTRSIIDVDFDGSADLLVLFHDGRPVFTKRASTNHAAGRLYQTVHREDGARLASMADPFQSETALRSIRATPGDEDWVGLSSSGGLPKTSFTLLGRFEPSERIVADSATPPSLLLRLPRSPRAPPFV